MRFRLPAGGGPRADSAPQAAEIMVARKTSQRSRPAAPPPRRSRSLSWLLAVVAVALVATIALAIRHRRAAAAAADVPAPPVPVPAAVMHDLAAIPAATWDAAGLEGVTAPILVTSDPPRQPKAVVLYIGSGWCPYCAAARWSLITALARFGTFSGLAFAESSPVDVYPSTPTFEFYGSAYASPYVDLQSVELEADVQLPDGRYAQLQRPTAEQEALIKKYDAPPYLPPSKADGIPFILVGGRYMWSGSPFSPALLAGRSQGAIAASLPTGAGDAARAVLANANQITATICAVDGNQPAEVCETPLMRRAVAALPGTTP